MKNTIKARIAPIFRVAAVALVIVVSMTALLTGCDNGTTSGGKTLVSIAVTTPPTKIVYTIGDTLDLSGLVVTATYSDGSTVAVSISAANVRGFDSSSTGSKKITITYEGKTADFTVTVSDGTQTPAAADFAINGLSQIFDGNPKTVTITSNHGKSTGAITIYYDGKTTAPSAIGSYPVTFDVAAATGWNAKTGLSAGTLVIGEQTANSQNPTAADFDIGNLSQTAGSVTAVTITPKAGKSGGLITIYYNGSTNLPTAVGSYPVTFNITAAVGWNAANSLNAGTLVIAAKTLTGIAITTQPAKTTYNLNEELNLTGLVVTATYNDNSTQVVTDYTTGGYDKTRTGDQTVTVTYNGKTATFTVNVINPALATVATPTASLSAGTYTTAQTVTLSTTTSGAAIHYTLDGSTPTTASTLYSSAISISATSTLKAFAVKEGMNDSSILTAAYTISSGPPSFIPPGTTVTTLTENVWADGNLPTENDVQWFKFTATANTQYIHVNFGTMNYLRAYVYDSSGSMVENEKHFYSSNKSNSWSVTVGQEYYIKTWPIGSEYTGTYWIVFNASTNAPLPPNAASAIPLTENTWADGNLPTSSDVQWYKFTATANTQYIHASFGTLTYLYVQVYDSSGATIGSETYLYSSNSYVSQTVIIGQEYYIKTRPMGSEYTGTYWIAFNASTNAPLPPNAASAIPLTENTWADGNLPTSSDVQWFKFTATASTQYIHASFGTLTYLYVQVYDSSGATVGSETNLYGSTTYVSQTVTVGQEYYIKVRPYGSNSGTYRIAFNKSNVVLPSNAIQLTANIWADGNLPTSSDVQWFKFTATASTQFIHASFGTLTNLYVQVYDSSGATIGSETYLYSSNSYVSQSVTVGQEYYIKVRSYSSGTYQIAFNATVVPPGAIQLTANTWADGNLPTSSDVQWFKFTATAGTQYIHVSFGTLTYLYVQMYDSSGSTVGSETDLNVSTKYVSRSVTVGQEYYIRVRPSGSGTYRIGFTASTTPPTIITLPSSAIPLTENIWADSNLPTSNGEQWFKFTATASTQYIHFNSGTLNSIYVQVYDSSGAAVGSEKYLSSGDSYVSQTVVGQEYYIRVRPIGTYQIGFNASSTTSPPGAVTLPSAAIQLTENNWADGNPPASSDWQWLKFTATASKQYLHASFNTLSAASWGADYQVYDSSGANVVGGKGALSSDGGSYYASKPITVTVGQEYYIRVQPRSSSSGTYSILFNSVFLAPGNFTTLTRNAYSYGNINTVTQIKWYRFTATASTHSIQVTDVSLGNDLYVSVYDSSGNKVLDQTKITSSSSVSVQSLTVGQDYYIQAYAFSTTGSFQIRYQ